MPPVARMKPRSRCRVRIWPVTTEPSSPTLHAIWRAKPRERLASPTNDVKSKNSSSSLSHVAPIDGKEYAEHRGGANTKVAELDASRRHRSAAHDNHGTNKRARTAKSSK